MSADRTEVLTRLAAEPTAFDYEGEKSFFSEAVSHVHPYEWLDDDMRLWIPGYPGSLENKLILDIGAGEALQGILLCEKYSPKHFVALELVPQRLLAASTRAGELDALSVLAGDAYRTPFRDATFDVVLGNGALHHMPDPDKVAHEVRRVLKPGGVFFGREPNFHNPAIRRRVLRSGDVSPNEWAVYPEEIKRSFGAEGFDVTIRLFWRRFPWVRGKHFAVSQAIEARLPGGPAS